MDRQVENTIAISALPDDVLYEIFQYAAAMQNYFVNTWKRRLLLLSVCRRWRHVALPVVYRHIGAVYGDIELSYKSFDEDTVEEEPDGDSMLDTNVDLVALARQTQSVRRLDITINHLVDPFIGIGRVVAMLKRHSSTWPSIRVLKITTECNPTLLARASIDTENMDVQIKRVVGEVSAAMPNVVKLESWSNSNNRRVSRFIGELSAAYSGNIRSIKSNHQLHIQTPHMFDMLMNLDVNFENSAVFQPPRINPSSLVYLQLWNTQPLNEWSMFVRNTEQSLEFSRLKDLVVRYEESNSDGYPQDVDFGLKKMIRCQPRLPVLERLKVICSSACPILEYAELPKQLQCLELVSSARVVDRFDKTRMPGINQLSMHLTCTNLDAHVNVFSAINKISNHAQTVAKVSLMVMTPLDANRLEGTCCPHITQLRVSASANVKLMLRLLEVCPNLVHALFYRTTVNDTPDKMLALPASNCVEQQVVAPANLSVKNITVVFTSGDECPEKAAALVPYLLIRLPSVESVCLAGMPSAPIRQFTKDYARLYPHLATVNVEFLNIITSIN